MSCERSLRNERATSEDANDSATHIATTTIMLTTLELNKIANATLSYLNMFEKSLYLATYSVENNEIAHH